jgi:exonuclease SbcC
MRIDEVQADAFGPLVGRRYRFAPGMTVIFGPNEAGKSSLHAALYAGLCGRRRGRGRPADDKEFAALHRPWDNAGRWEVGAVVTLSNGRRVELHHDLEGNVACRATDDFGRDVSGEIMNDGSPDGSRWVGLDRRSFLSTACVGQADVFAVVEDASQLQEELQRAAASAGKDETAARALALMDEFRREHVGRDQANSTKPLRQAKERLADAQGDLETRQREHQALIDLSTQVDLAAAEETETHSQIRLLEAALARHDADLLSSKLKMVKELSARFALGPPRELAEDNELADSVARALQAWTERPSIPELSGPSSKELEATLEHLPSPPEGDLKPLSSVEQAFQEYQRATQALELHELAKPEVATMSPARGASEEDLRALGRDLATVQPAVDVEAERTIGQLREKLASSGRSRNRRRFLLAVGASAAAAGVLALILGATTLGATLLIFGLGGCIGLLATGGDGLRTRQLEQLLALEGAYGERRHAIAAAQEVRTVAAERARAMGLPADPEVLRRVAGEVAAAERSIAAAAAWEERRGTLQTSLRQVESALAAALAARGESPGEDMLQAMERYRAACAARAVLAIKAAERPALESRLADRLAAENAATEAVGLRDAAERRRREVGVGCGLHDSAADQLVSGLDRWRLNRQENLRQVEADRSAWSTLHALRGGKGLSDLERETLEAANYAQKLSHDLDGGQIEAVALDGDVQDRLARLRAQLGAATRKASELKGKLLEQRRRYRSVAEAEEALSFAETELARVQRLDETLRQTHGYLERAQERVHRSIAPALREALNKWLPRVTSGRYSESVVDPESLKVKVRAAGGNWREANLLSEGTAEQVYLLLRIALVEHLTRPSGEICPLILDDVMVQTDETRKTAFLEILHEVSSERQVILFTMEPSIADWARSTLREEMDLLICLDGSDIAA